MKYLVIGDPHCDEKRYKAWDIAIHSICRQIIDEQFDNIIITGDLFNKTPTIKERVMFAKFLNMLQLHTEDITLIKGTDSHEFSKGFYNYEDILLLTNITAVEELQIDKFIFGHYEVKGTKYVNGYLSQSTKKVNPNLTYILGHIHSSQCSFNNVHYVGSMYKTSFSEINDVKRIAIIDSGNIRWINIHSRPMYEITLTGDSGKVTATGLKNLKEAPTKEIDLKIKVITDSQTLSAIHRAIYKLKRKFNVEYYADDIKITEVKTDVPTDLNQEELLKKFCKLKKIDYSLVEREVKKDDRG